MKLTCPCCGAVASVEAWQNDLEARAVLASAIKLDEPIPRQLLPYLGLFRPKERALSWKRAARLIMELSALVATGHVHVHGRPDRPCPPSVWAMAMEQMAERGESISRPMTNHNYLRQVAWQLADKLDADIEARQYREERDGTAQAERRHERQDEVKLTDAERKTLQRLGLDKTIERMRANTATK